MDAILHHQTFLLHEAEVARRLELRRRAAERAERAGPSAGPVREVAGPAGGRARRWARTLSSAALRRRFGAPAVERRRRA